MPGISGYDVCRALKQVPELSRIPVIFLSAKAGVEDYIEGFETGGADYISKPFVAEILLARIAIHIQLFVQQRELDRFYRRREEQRREERHAAYRLHGSMESIKTVLDAQHRLTEWPICLAAHYGASVPI